jgi:hypothetical protein
MMRPYGPEIDPTRELEVRAALVRALRTRDEGTAPARSTRRPAQALAGALRRAANRLDAPGTTTPAASPAPGVAAPC